jgi:hypothetical protein
VPAAPKRVFLSYAWESEEYRLWVKSLATRLRQDGVEARLDAWHLEENDNLSDFMGREVRLADWLLILCSPAYRAKVHAAEEGQRLSGVGWEARLMTGRLLAGYESKIVTVLARGSWREAAPDFLLGRLYEDLSNPRTFETAYRSLLQRITETGEKPPELGPLPPNLEPDPVEPLRGSGSVGWEEATVAETDLCVQFTLREVAVGGWSVELQTDGQAPQSSRFEVDLTSPDSQPRKELEKIRDNSCSADDIRSLGNELWTRLLSGPNEKAYDRLLQRWEAGGVFKIRFALPPSLESLPWEAIYDFEKECCLATHPLASVVRVPDEDGPWVCSPGEEVSPLRMLVAIPGGSGLRTSSEWEKIRESARSAGDRVVLESLDGLVTLDRFAESLHRKWDVIHFIGHGRLNDQARVELRFNAHSTEDEQWVSARLFAQQFFRHSARLVVVNCCYAGDVPSASTPAAVSLPNSEAEAIDPQALRGLGTYLAKARVPAVLVMRHAVQDSAAADFSAAFYRELLGGERAGRVDLAVQEGRASLERNYRDDRRVRSFISPLLYLAPGFEQLFALSAPALDAVVPPPLQLEIDPRIDQKLLDGLRSCCCLPILGPRILAADAERNRPVPPGPSSLAQVLAEQSAFPDFARITPLTESSADWLTPVVFERICQHFESVSPGERRALNQMIRETYGAFVPSPVVEQVAAWRVPGVIYTYVDALLERSLLQRKGRNLRVVQADDLRQGVSPGSGEEVLVNLRGSYLAPSMVLTEEDEDRLLDRMPVIAGFIADLMNRVGGCTLLFLGVSPRDPLVRALARSLLRDDVARNRGTAFFVCDHSSAADRSYWRQFKKLEWLELDDESLINGLSAVAQILGGQP